MSNGRTNTRNTFLQSWLGTRTCDSDTVANLVIVTSTQETDEDEPILS